MPFPLFSSPFVVAAHLRAQCTLHTTVRAHAFVLSGYLCLYPVVRKRCPWPAETDQLLQSSFQCECVCKQQMAIDSVWTNVRPTCVRCSYGIRAANDDWPLAAAQSQWSNCVDEQTTLSSFLSFSFSQPRSVHRSENTHRLSGKSNELLSIRSQHSDEMCSVTSLCSVFTLRAR